MKARLQRISRRIRSAIKSGIEPRHAINPEDAMTLLRGATDEEFAAAVKAWDPRISDAKLQLWISAFHRANGTADSRPPAR